MDGPNKVMKLLSPIIFGTNIVGCNPLNQSKKSLFIWSTSVILLIICWALNIINALTDSNENMVKNIFQICIWAQIFTKLICFGVYRKNIRNIIKTINTSFWLKSRDKIIEKKIDYYFRIMRIGSNSYIIVIICISCLFLSEAAFRETKSHPFSLWVPFKSLLLQSPYYEIMYAFQIMIFALFIFCCAIMSNAFLGLMIGFQVMQLDLLSLKLGSMSQIEDHEEAYDLLKICVAHHICLLDFLKDINIIFQYVNLEELIRDIFYICFTIYMFLLQRNPFSIILTFGTYITLSQICLLGEIATTKGAKIRTVAYEANWEMIGNTKLTRGLQLMILRAQKDVKLYAGGFTELSLETFVVVTKTAVSFFIFLKQVIGEKV